VLESAVFFIIGAAAKVMTFRSGIGSSMVNAVKLCPKAAIALQDRNAAVGEPAPFLKAAAGGDGL